ncbi:unnamed protein product, partial [Polarella glacialis]
DDSDAEHDSDAEFGSEDEGATIEMLESWAGQKRTLHLNNVAKNVARLGQRSPGGPLGSRSSLRAGMTTELGGISTDGQSALSKFLHSFVTKPTCTKRVGWELFGLVLIIYDLIWLPVQVFDPEGSDFTNTLAVISSVYWTADIPYCFFVGFMTRQEKVVEMRLGPIARNYIKTWFPFDLLVVLIDWILNIMDVNAGSTGVSYLRLGKIFRFVRLLRVLRLFKPKQVLSELLKRMQSEASMIVIGIVQLLGFILLALHIVACAWFYVGSYGDRPDNWVSHFHLKSKNIIYQYTTCLHWSITQLTPAGMEVYPVNEVERVFNILIIIGSLVTFSSFVSTITNGLNQLRNLNGEQNELLATMRKYCSENRIPTPLLAQVNSSLQDVLAHSRRRLHAKDVKALALLPTTVRVELYQIVYSPVLARHPLFGVLQDQNQNCGMRLCVDATEDISLPIGGELFASGQEGSKIYYILSGTVKYINQMAQGGCLKPSVGLGSCQAGDWISEPALWVKWRHPGSLNVATQSEIVALESAKVSAVLLREPSLMGVAYKYARSLVKHLQVQSARGTLTDLQPPIETLLAMVEEAMSMESVDGKCIRRDTSDLPPAPVTEFKIPRGSLFKSLRRGTSQQSLV